MEREQYQQVAIVAGALAVIVALMSGRLPRWLRIVLVLSLGILGAGAGLFGYRYFTQPTTLTIATGSLDGDVPRIMSAIAARMASTNAPVRLKVVDKATAQEAAKEFAAGKVDLTIARADTVDLSLARTVLTVTHGVVLIVVPPASPIEDMDGLKGKTVGVIAGDTNRQVIAAVTKEYALESVKVNFKDLTLTEVPQAFQTRQIQALLVVMPLSEKYITMLREIFPRNAKAPLGLVPIESAGAIEAVSPPYKSYELPKGTLRGSPPVPDDDLTTLRVPFYLVANKNLSDDVVAGLAKSMMEARRDLAGEYPLLAQVTSPSTDKDAYVPIHPGAAAVFDGDEKTVFDKYGDQFFYGSMLLGTMMSILAAIWKFMTRDIGKPDERPSMRLYALVGKINEVKSEAELATIEQQIDEILKDELEKCSAGKVEPGEMGAISLASQRLQYLMAQRRLTLNGTSSTLLRA
ncbi:MAG TPA: TAXI family TRAP transporter solute-binding subunit [Pseudolabrys sp.]|jgi:TRAP transporter TAXI family solute receptor|nr:TAXI family TRAP transporter solute-binding subunit [Pseudolabrys sp.]